MKKLRAILFVFGAILCLPGRAVAQANLTPYQPPGWSDKIVVSPNANNSTNYTGTFVATETLYVAWCVINSGSQTASAGFDVDLYVDGALSQSFPVSALQPGFYSYYYGIQIGTLSAGTHAVEMVVDPSDAVTNDNHADNSYTKMITVQAVTAGAPTPLSPVNGSTGLPEVPFFSWTAPTNANKYRILLATNGADLPSSTTASNGGPSVVINAVTLTNSFSPSITLTPNQNYFWEVHGIVAGSDSGTWSGIQRFATGPSGNGVTIIPTFDSSITSDPNAATIEATINAAISVYRQNFSDQITVNFEFAEMSSGLGDNSSSGIVTSYLSYRAALASHATTADDATALAHLPSQTNNPVNGNADIFLHDGLARALGFGANISGSDATVYLNTSIMNLSSLGTNTDSYSLFSTVSHEMDEALGFGSALNGLTNGQAAPTGVVLPEDLFRYDGFGNRSFTTALNATSYCSLDGTTDLAQFSQYDGGDFGDWYSYNVNVVPQVQDAFLAPAVFPVLGVELRVLDAIGFTRIIPTYPVVVAQLTPLAVSGTNFEFNLSGLVGSNYVIQASSNLTSWLPVSTNTVLSTGSVVVTNTVSGQNRKFYRAMLP